MSNFQDKAPLIGFVNPVIPGHEDKQVVIGGNGTPFRELAIIPSPLDGFPCLFRIHLTEEARQAVAAGCDIIFSQWTGGRGFQAVSVALMDPKSETHINAVLEAYGLK